MYRCSYMVVKKEVSDNTMLQKMIKDYLGKLYDDINIGNINLNNFPSLIRAMIKLYVEHISDIKFGNSLIDNKELLFAFNELDETYGIQDFDMDIYRPDD